MALTAKVDAADTGRITFSEPVTLHQAVAYLWAMPPSRGDALVPEGPHHGQAKFRHFRINKSDLDLINSLQHGVAQQYSPNIIQSRASAELPSWVPSGAKQAMREGKIKPGIS